MRDKRYFYDKGMKAAADEERKKEESEKEQKSRWANEANRVHALRKYCYDNKLDFNIENQRAIATLKRRNQLTVWLESIAALVFVGALIMWIFTTIGNWLVWLPAIVLSATIFVVTDAKIDPKLPDDFFKKIKDGTYCFDK